MSKRREKNPDDPFLMDRTRTDPKRLLDSYEERYFRAWDRHQNAIIAKQWAEKFVDSLGWFD